jgi:hypothetical protein
MSQTLKRGGVTIAGLLMLLCMSGVQAATVNFTVTGSVDSAFGTTFGLNVGSTITASGTFDDSAISTSPYTVYFDLAHSGNTMTITAGSLTLNQTQDDSYASGGFPKIVFDNSGNFLGIDFHVGFPDYSAFDSYSSNLPNPSTFILNDASFNTVSGTWTASSFAMTPVPVPAALWLFGSGLLGLVGLTKRKQKK